jgi:hypothetical protein
MRYCNTNAVVAICCNFRFIGFGSQQSVGSNLQPQTSALPRRTFVRPNVRRVFQGRTFVCPEARHGRKTQFPLPLGAFVPVR